MVQTVLQQFREQRWVSSEIADVVDMARRHGEEPGETGWVGLDDPGWGRRRWRSVEGVSQRCMSALCHLLRPCQRWPPLPELYRGDDWAETGWQDIQLIGWITVFSVPGTRLRTSIISWNPQKSPVKCKQLSCTDGKWGSERLRNLAQMVDLCYLQSLS